MERRLRIKPSAFLQFSSRCGADPSTKELIKAKLKELETEPERGYKIPFTYPLFYQLQISDYRVHYTFNDYEVMVLYIGKPGVC